MPSSRDFNLIELDREHRDLWDETYSKWRSRGVLFAVFYPAIPVGIFWWEIKHYLGSEAALLIVTALQFAFILGLVDRIAWAFARSAVRKSLAGVDASGAHLKKKTINIYI